MSEELKQPERNDKKYWQDIGEGVSVFLYETYIINLESYHEQEKSKWERVEKAVSIIAGKLKKVKDAKMTLSQFEEGLDFLLDKITTAAEEVK